MSKNPYMPMIIDAMAAVDPKLDPREPVKQLLLVKEAIDKYVGANVCNIGLAEGMQTKDATADHSSKAKVYLCQPDGEVNLITLSLLGGNGFPCIFKVKKSHEKLETWCETSNDLTKAIRSWFKLEITQEFLEFAKRCAR